MLPLEVIAVVAGLVCAMLVVGVFLLVAYGISRRKEPPSPDYNAIGNFQPPSVFTWDSSTSITKSLHEEQHTVQPRYVGVPRGGGSVGSLSSSGRGGSSSGRSQLHSDDESGSVNSSGTVTGHCSASGCTSPATGGVSSLSYAARDRRSLFKDAVSLSSKNSRNRTLSELSESSSASMESSCFDAASLSGIKPELYQRKDSVLRQESAAEALGRLHVRIQYDFRTSDLIVHLIEAQDLSGLERTAGFHDPFVKLKLEPSVDNKLRQSSIKRQAKNPVFNEYFKWPVGFDELKEKTLTFEMFDFDKYSHNELVGEVKVEFRVTDVSSTVELWCDIEPASSEEGMGELLLSLSYLPTAERLTTVIIKARNLKQPRASTKIDPLVRTTLCVDGKTIKRKRTSAQKATLNPVWNEAHVFSLAPHLLDSATLEFAVADHELIGHGDIIGQCVLGKTRQGLEGLHWQDMSLNVRKAVAKWQILRSA